MGRQHQGMDRPGVHQVPEGSGGRGKMEKTGCQDICGAPITPAVKGQVKKVKFICHKQTKISHCLLTILSRQTGQWGSSVKPGMGKLPP